MMCQQRKCPECSDRMIHQNKRGADEAASGLLQWIHDNLPKSMDVIDDDYYTERFDVVRRKVRPPLWRRIEHKPIGGRVRESQSFLLPLIAATIDGQINRLVLHPSSGVYIVWADLPYDWGRIAKVMPHAPFSHGPIKQLKGNDWERFWLCQDLEEAK